MGKRLGLHRRTRLLAALPSLLIFLGSWQVLADSPFPICGVATPGTSYEIIEGERVLLRAGSPIVVERTHAEERAVVSLHGSPLITRETLLKTLRACAASRRWELYPAILQSWWPITATAEEQERLRAEASGLLGGAPLSTLNALATEAKTSSRGSASLVALVFDEFRRRDERMPQRLVWSGREVLGGFELLFWQDIESDTTRYLSWFSALYRERSDIRQFISPELLQALRSVEQAVKFVEREEAEEAITLDASSTIDSRIRPIIRRLTIDAILRRAEKQVNGGQFLEAVLLLRRSPGRTPRMHELLSRILREMSAGARSPLSIVDARLFLQTVALQDSKLAEELLLASVRQATFELEARRPQMAEELVRGMRHVAPARKDLFEPLLFQTAIAYEEEGQESAAALLLRDFQTELPSGMRLQALFSLGTILAGVCGAVLLVMVGLSVRRRRAAFRKAQEMRTQRGEEEELPLGPGFAPRARDVFLDPEVAQCLADMGLRSDASMEDVKQVYRKFVKRHHPDLKPGSPMASSEFVVVTKAYERLQVLAQQGKIKQK